MHRLYIKNFYNLILIKSAKPNTQSQIGHLFLYHKAVWIQWWQKICPQFLRTTGLRCWYSVKHMGHRWFRQCEQSFCVSCVNSSISGFSFSSRRSSLKVSPAVLALLLPDKNKFGYVIKEKWWNKNKKILTQSIRSLRHRKFVWRITAWNDVSFTHGNKTCRFLEPTV